MPEHAAPARKPAEPAASAKAPAAAAPGGHGELVSRRSEALAGYAQRLAPRGETGLSRCAQLLARRATANGPTPPAQAAGPQAVQFMPNRTGLPNRLKAGVEALSGHSMDDVRVHRNSAEPAKLGALAHARGSDIHLGPGQERHLPHEAWHVAQQKQGRVGATAQLKGGIAINDDAALEREADVMGARALNRPARDIAATTRPDALQRKPVVQRAERDAITVAAELARKYNIHLNTMAEVTEEKYLFTAEEWLRIVSAYNAGAGSLRLRYSYDESRYIGHVENQIAVQGSGATTLDGIRALARRYAIDAQARPGFYGEKIGKAAASTMVGLAVTMVAGPAAGAAAASGAGVMLNSDVLRNQAGLAHQQYASGDYRNALITLGQLGLSVGSSVASGTGHGHLAQVGTAMSMAGEKVRERPKTE